MLVERLNIARHDPASVPFPCVEAIAAGDFIQKFLQLFGLQRSQSLAWRGFNCSGQKRASVFQSHESR